MMQPTESPIDVDLEEGSKDSDEVLASSIGISGAFNSVTFNDTSGGSGGNIRATQETSQGVRTTGRPSTSLGVKKRGEAMKKKPSSAMKIVDALSRITASNDLDSNRALAWREEEDARAQERSITIVISHLTEVDEITCDLDLFARCTQLLMDKPEARETYVVLKHKREQLVIFLKHHTKGL